jgi:hypothetical protein
MKKSNPARQKLLQKKRTKRNAARKGVKYDPTKMEQRAKAALQAGSTPQDERVSETTFVL